MSKQEVDCRIVVEFEDGHTDTHMEGTTLDLVAGGIGVVRALYEALEKAHGGRIAKIMFKNMVMDGLPFDDDTVEVEDSNIEVEEC